MEHTLNNDLTNIFLNNYEIIKKENKWEYDMINQFIALSYSIADKDFNMIEFKDFLEYIKQNTKLFSEFRGLSRSMIASLLLTEFPDSKDKFLEVSDLYDKITSSGFKKSAYTPLAAYTLYKTCKNFYEIDDKIKRSLDIYNEMKNNHPFLTSYEDYMMAILLAESDETITNLMFHMEEVYTKLNDNGFSKGNGLQMTSHILNFSDEDTIVKVARCVKIKELFKDRKIKIYSQSYASIAFLSLLGNDTELLVDNIVDIYSSIKNHKSFKWSSKEIILSLSIMIYSQSVIADIAGGNEILQASLCASIESIIAAQTAAMIAASGAAAAAASSASSSS